MNRLSFIHLSSSNSKVNFLSNGPYPYLKYETDLSLCTHCPENFSQGFPTSAKCSRWWRRDCGHCPGQLKSSVYQAARLDLVWNKEKQSMGTGRRASCHSCPRAPCHTNTVSTSWPTSLNRFSSGTKKRLEDSCPIHLHRDHLSPVV